MTLSGLVEFASVRYPTRAALVDVDRSWTWAELADVVGRTRAALVDAGVSPGERVGVHCHKSASGFKNGIASVQKNARGGQVKDLT